MKITQEEYEHQIHLGNHMAIRFHVARSLCEYFNQIYMPGSHFFDVNEEIKAQSKRLIEQYDSGIHIGKVLDDWRKGWEEKKEIPDENKKMGCNHPGDICKA